MAKRLFIRVLVAAFALFAVLQAAAQPPSRGGGAPGRPYNSFAPGRGGLGGDFGGPGSRQALPAYRGARPPDLVPPPPNGASRVYAPEPDRRANSLGANSLGAGWRQQQEEARTGVRQGQFAPLGRVIAGLQRKMPGRQLDTGLEYDGGRAVYRVRWMTAQGRRVDVFVDAASGAILRQK